MNARQLAARRRTDVIEKLRHAAQLLKRAKADPNNMSHELHGDGPLDYPFAVGAARMSIWLALEILGDRTLLNEWEAECRAEREARGARSQTSAVSP